MGGIPHRAPSYLCRYPTGCFAPAPIFAPDGPSLPCCPWGWDNGKPANNINPIVNVVLKTSPSKFMFSFCNRHWDARVHLCVHLVIAPYAPVFVNPSYMDLASFVLPHPTTSNPPRSVLGPWLHLLGPAAASH
eukprot:EG_transcript_26934